MYDLGIIGGGPAGYSAAFEAIKNHLTVVLFECNSMGGTCLNKGCVPTKYLSYVARKYSEAKNSNDGILFQNVKLEYNITKAKMNKIIISMRESLSESLMQSGVEIVSGNAVLKDKGIIECDGQNFETKNILIATGSVANTPLINTAKTSDEMLDLDYIPKNLHIIGGGAIAVEFAEIYQMFGSEVSISIRGDRILRTWDKELAVGMAQSMKKKGIKINKKCDFSSLDFSQNEIVMSATGRKANIPKTECQLFDIGSDGGIVVDENGQTKTKGVFAAGDVIEGSIQLAHVAMDEGRRVVRFIAKGDLPPKGSVINCIYPNQEIASVGLTEKEAKDMGIDYVIAKQTMYSNARSVISTEERGIIKAIAAKEGGRVLGAQLMCEHAGELVTEFAMAVDQGMTIEDMLHTVRPHPSYCEAIQDLLRILEDKINEM